MACTKDVFGFPLVPLGEAEQRAREVSSLRDKTRLVKAWGTGVVNGVVSLPRGSALKNLVRKGIPYNLRPALWFTLSGAAQRREMFPSNYYHCMASATKSLAPELGYSLEEEVRTTFRQHALLQTKEGMEAVRHMLTAFLHHTSATTYPKGLGCVAAFTLVVMGLQKEEEAFWCFTSLIEDRVFATCQGQLSLGSKVEQLVLERLVQRKLPKVHEHILKADSSIPALTAGWFSTLFAAVLPAEKFEATLLRCTFGPELKRVLECRASHMFDAEDLLAIAFRGVGPMPTSTIADLRAGAWGVIEQKVHDGVVLPPPVHNKVALPLHTIVEFDQE